MTRKVLHKALRISRGLALATGAIVICAVVLGAATTALAAAPGDPFRLGQINSINKFTKLVGAGNAPRLILDNNGSGVALRVLVEPGKPPMQVNSTGKVTRLNADKVDGLDQGAFLRKNGKATDADKLDGKDSGDFLSPSMYRLTATGFGPGGANQPSVLRLSCNSGDAMLSGGYAHIDEGTHIFTNTPPISSAGAWEVTWKNDATKDFVEIRILCADLTP